MPPFSLQHFTFESNKQKKELKSRIYNNKLKDFSTTNVKIQKIAFVIFFLKKHHLYNPYIPHKKIEIKNPNSTLPIIWTLKASQQVQVLHSIYSYSIPFTHFQPPTFHTSDRQQECTNH